MEKKNKIKSNFGSVRGCNLSKPAHLFCLLALDSRLFSCHFPRWIDCRINTKAINCDAAEISLQWLFIGSYLDMHQSQFHRSHILFLLAAEGREPTTMLA